MKAFALPKYPLKRANNTFYEFYTNDFEDIRMGENRYSPFDIKEINYCLRPSGLLYGAGYARSLKPTFFLAEIEDHRSINGLSVYILNHEWIRDLFAAPGMLQENEVFVRKGTDKALDELVKSQIRRMCHFDRREKSYLFNGLQNKDFSFHSK